MRRSIVRLTGAGALLAIALLGAPVVAGQADAGGGCHVRSQTTEGEGTAVSLKDCGFAPVVLRAPVGGSVSWSNDDYLPHSVQGLGWGMGSLMDVMQPRATYAHTFTAAGIYPYMCYVHPGMSGVVIVGDIATGPVVGAPPAEPAPAPAPSSNRLAVALGIGGILMGFGLASLRRPRMGAARLEPRSSQAT